MAGSSGQSISRERGGLPRETAGGAEAGRQPATWGSPDIIGGEKGSQTITFRRLSRVGTQGCYRTHLSEVWGSLKDEAPEVPAEGLWGDSGRASGGGISSPRAILPRCHERAAGPHGPPWPQLPRSHAVAGPHATPPAAPGGLAEVSHGCAPAVVCKPQHARFWDLHSRAASLPDRL